MDAVNVLSNRPAIPSPETLRELLADENQDILRRREELLAGFSRAPETVETDEVAGKVSDFVKQVDAATKLVESRRKAAKEPALAAGRTVDGFFQPITDSLAKARDTLKGRVEIYLRKKAAEEQRRRDEEARRAEEERKRAEAEALKAAAEQPTEVAETKIDEAIAAQQAAAQATAATEAKPAELSRTRGEFGSVSSLRTVWVGEIEDKAKLDLDALRPYLATDAIEKALRAFVRAGGRELKGARIYQQDSAVIR